MAGDRQISSGQVGVVADVNAAQSVTRLLDALIEEAPSLVRQRNLLPSADWRKATPAQVARLSQQLMRAGMAMPAWLARGILIAGHALPSAFVEKLEPDLGLLAAINSQKLGAGLPETLRQSIWRRAAGAAMDASVANAIAGRLVDCNDPSLASRFALGQWQHAPSLLRLARKQTAAEIDGLPRLRIRLAGFSTTRLLAEALKPAFGAIGRRVEVEEAAFGAVFQGLMAPAADVDAVVLLLDRESYFGSDWRGGLDVVVVHQKEKLDALIAAIEAYSRQSSAPLLINLLPAATEPSLGYMDSIHGAGAAALVALVNRRVTEVAEIHSSVHVVDADTAMAALAPADRCDDKLVYYGRIAYSDAATRALATAFAGAWQARQRGPVKVVAVDFDNTLWGGVFGDDGIDKLTCGDDFPGNAFKAFQRDCLRLKAQGVLLVGLSKNNPDAIDVFNRHPGMALKADDFAVTAINWEPKPDNIRRLARELNLGLDSFLFLDDSPHEREAMRRMCPEVIVPEMPADPALRPGWLRALPCTWPVRITSEDTRRADMYMAERKARQEQEAATSYDEYLAGLGQRLVIEPLSAATLARVTQLHQRTNQFNLTTRRFSEQELAQFMREATGALVLMGTVSDRFGDHGITVTGVARIDGKTAWIESLLMSCRSHRAPDRARICWGLYRTTRGNRNRADRRGLPADREERDGPRFLLLARLLIQSRN